MLSGQYNFWRLKQSKYAYESLIVEYNFLRPNQNYFVYNFLRPKQNHYRFAFYDMGSICLRPKQNHHVYHRRDMVTILEE